MYTIICKVIYVSVSDQYCFMYQQHYNQADSNCNIQAPTGNGNRLLLGLELYKDVWELSLSHIGM